MQKTKRKSDIYNQTYNVTTAYQVYKFPLHIVISSHSSFFSSLVLVCCFFFFFFFLLFSVFSNLILWVYFFYYFFFKSCESVNKLSHLQSYWVDYVFFFCVLWFMYEFSQVFEKIELYSIITTLHRIILLSMCKYVSINILCDYKPKIPNIINFSLECLFHTEKKMKKRRNILL